MGATINIPKELSKYFSEIDFIDYPLINIPQKYQDNRGIISNLADGKIGDIAIITSHNKTIRAGHYHKNDWHLCYLIDGEFEYQWSSINSTGLRKLKVKPGELIYTPNKVYHELIFKKDSTFISISKLSRISAAYEKDTVRITNFLKIN